MCVGRRVRRYEVSSTSSQVQRTLNHAHTYVTSYPATWERTFRQVCCYFLLTYNINFKILHNKYSYLTETKIYLFRREFSLVLLCLGSGIKVWPRFEYV
jgi:hypothetical protein